MKFPHFDTTPAWQQAPSPPDFSVVIPCYNHAHTVAETVASIIQQSHPNWELLIVNDGSTDGSETVAKELLQAYPHLRLALLTQANSGHPALARNAGIAKTRADWLLCLDADDQISPNFLTCAQALITDKPWIGLAYPTVSSLNDPHFEPVQHPFEVKKMLEWVLIPTATMFHRKAWEAVGGYFPTGYEDWDFWLGCLEEGFFPQPIPEAHFYYRSSLTGVYGSHLSEDGRFKAKIIERHPALFSSLQRYWAQKVLAQPDALSLHNAFRAGTMPDFPGDTVSPCVEVLQSLLERFSAAPKPPLSLKEQLALHLTRLPFTQAAQEVAWNSQGETSPGNTSRHRGWLIPEESPFPIQAQFQVGEDRFPLKLPLAGPLQADLPPELASVLLEYPQRLLMLGNLQDSHWEKHLADFLIHPQTETLLALWLPNAEPENWLLNWLELHSLKPETIPELLLMPALTPEHSPVLFPFFEQIYLAPGSPPGLALQILISGKTLWIRETEVFWPEWGGTPFPLNNRWFERWQASEPGLKALRAEPDFRQRWNQTCFQDAEKICEQILLSLQ